MSQFELCVLDCTSIQKYVFGSNKLKTNMGASQNVADIFDMEIKATLNQIYENDASKFKLDNWKAEKPLIALSEESDHVVEAGYIGGGNALLLFKGKDKAKEFVGKWSRRVMLNYPGIVPAAAVEPFDEILNNDIPQNIIQNVFVKLIKNKTVSIPQTSLPQHGITATCSSSGKSIDILPTEKSFEKKWISSIVKSKLDRFAEAKKLSNDEFKLLQDEFRFADDLEKLGQLEAQNHIAIVHIDGNSMGTAFQKCPTLNAKRTLSSQVKDATEEAWLEMVKRLRDEMPNLTYKENRIANPVKEYSRDNEKNYQILPLRRILVNGDDITFVCNASLSFWLVNIFLNEFSKKTYPEGADSQKSMSACAGIAIVKTKFPFYRAYELAEELCASAKIKGRNAGESWIDFEIVYGGLSGDLDDIREKKYRISDKSLLTRPWRMVKKNNSSKPNTWENVSSVLQKFDNPPDGKQKWPRSKLKEMMHTLAQGKQASDNLRLINEARDLYAPEFPGCDNSWWADKSTPYFDILQILEFYPKSLWEDK